MRKWLRKTQGKDVEMKTLTIITLVVIAMALSVVDVNADVITSQTSTAQIQLGDNIDFVFSATNHAYREEVILTGPEYDIEVFPARSTIDQWGEIVQGTGSETRYRPLGQEVNFGRTDNNGGAVLEIFYTVMLQRDWADVYGWIVPPAVDLTVVRRPVEYNVWSGIERGRGDDVLIEACGDFIDLHCQTIRPILNQEVSIRIGAGEYISALQIGAAYDFQYVGRDLQGFNASTPVLPEPVTLTLLAVGGLVALRPRRNRS